MKTKNKLFAGLLIGLMILCNVAIAGAETIEVQSQDKQTIKSIVFAIGKSEYYVNGRTPGVKMDAAPFIENSRTFVPVRFLANALGVADNNIGWTQSAQQVKLTSGNVVATMNIGSKDIYSNGVKTIMDVSPQIKPPGRTFLPARYVAEALGFQVDWQNGKYVVVWPKGETKPDVEAVKNYIEQKPQQPPAPEGYKTTSMGYQIPTDTKMEYDDVSGDVNLTLLIIITKGDLETQFKQAEEILAKAHGAQAAKEVVDYARQKTTFPLELKDKEFGKLRVYSQWNSPAIYIEVWR